MDKRQSPKARPNLNIFRFPGADTPIRFFPQMLDWVAAEIYKLVKDSGLHPSEIVVLAPFLSDSLRFSLGHRLDKIKIPWRSHRPSRSFSNDPSCRSLLTISALAHPQWNITPTRYDWMLTLMSAIEGLDLVRAHLLSEIIYHPKDASLSSFSAIQPEMQDRITKPFGERFEQLREWILDFQQNGQTAPLDQFLRRLFGEILSQKGFGFHRNSDASLAASGLIESARKFRQVMENLHIDEKGRNIIDGSFEFDVSREYIQMFNDGVISAQYLGAWEHAQHDSILLAPAHTFLMMNQPVSVQFWLDIGSSGWWERLFQPLTHPYVLSRAWDVSRPWTDRDEQLSNQQTLLTLLCGLMKRCRRNIYLGISDMSESGYEQRGPLLKALWKLQMEEKRLNETG